MRDGNNLPPNTIITPPSHWVLEVTMRDGNLRSPEVQLWRALLLCFRSDYEGWKLGVL